MRVTLGAPARPPVGKLSLRARVAEQEDQGPQVCPAMLAYQAC